LIARWEEDMPWNPDSQVPHYNPLGKVPVLELDDGGTCYDSRVIVEYLDNISPVARLLQENRRLINTRRWEALADGITDAAVAIVLEPQASRQADAGVDCPPARQNWPRPCGHVLRSGRTPMV
jgi:glutathione S-transferase